MKEDEDIQQTESAEKLIKKRNKYKTLFKERYQNFVQVSENASTFVRGTHFEGGSLRRTGSTDLSPEDRFGDNREYFAVPYLPSRIDKIVQYVRGEDVQPSVEAEEVYNFPELTPQFQEVMELVQQHFENMTHNEIYAKMLTARLDLFCDRSQMARIENEILDISAMERVTGVYVSHYEDESTKEPVRVEICQPGNFGFDPDAAKIEEGRFSWYTERSVDKKSVEHEYKVKLQSSTIDQGGIRTDDRRDIKGLVDLEHWWYRDTTTIDKEVEDQDGNKSTEAVYKYRSGWRYVVYCNDNVIYDGQPKTPLGWNKPPLLVHCWRPMPRTIVGMSLYDLTKDQNRAMDRFMQTAVKTAERQQPKTLVNKNAIDDVDAFSENQTAQNIPLNLKPGEAIGNAFAHIAGGSPNVANIEMFDRVVRMTDEMSGATGLVFDDASTLDLSGDAIEGIAQDRDGVAGRVRDNWTWFRKDLYTLIAQMLIDFAREPVTVKIQTPQGPLNVPLAEDAFNITSDSYEARFDIVVDTPRNVPRNPVKRSQYWLSILNTVAVMAEKDPSLALLYIQTSDLPNKAQLLEYVQKVQARAQAQAQAGQANPQGGAELAAEMAKMQAQAVENEQEAKLKVQTRAAETVTDILEEAGKTIAKEDPDAAVVFSQQIPELVKRAFAGEDITIQPQPVAQTEPLQG